MKKGLAENPFLEGTEKEAMTMTLLFAGRMTAALRHDS
jgi:hypothetical protein